ncbi:LPS export ABC transporter periplasmic protein LptC [Hydrogenimonas sp. SS33]|uniref:LPS export ABC transporter periplasmic protein LptC n=1 Tax=Hydrogenimonas leucolamina TaxID=2954236 RepID=UPI00336BFC6D
MDLGIRFFVWGLFLLTLAAIFTLQPYHVGIVEKKGIPGIVFEDFKSYEITPKGVESILSGHIGKKFAHTVIVEEVNLTRLAPMGSESLRAGRAIVRDNRDVQLRKHVRLARSDGWRMKTDHLDYFAKRDLYTTGNLPFILTYGESVVHGRALRYNRKSGKIRARSIRARINEKDIPGEK